MMERKIIAILGTQDEPTDAIEEYCQYLGDALHGAGFATELARVAWAGRGWSAALRELRQQAREWRGKWVLVQYTALAWSARGFPLRFLSVIKELRAVGAQIAIVYHDVEPYGGARTIDKMRRRAQLRVMRRALKAVDLAIFTAPLHVVSWLAEAPANAIFIPVGANLPPSTCAASNDALPRAPFSVAVFGITEGSIGTAECDQILAAVRYAASHGVHLRLHAFGRGTSRFESQLRDALRDLEVEVRVDGVLPAEQVVEAFSSSHVALFVRGSISTRRGSGVAAIACGLPVIAYAGPETVAPITEAGVVLVPQGKETALGEALVRVLCDADFRTYLADRSRRAHQEYFGWAAIAASYVEALGKYGLSSSA